MTSDHRAVGAHVPVAGGLATGGLRYARQVGAEVIQVFVTNPRGWALTSGDREEDVRLREHAHALPVFVHAPYLINLGSPTPQTLERSVESLRHSLRRGRDIGAWGVVVHTGSAVAGARHDSAMAQVRDALLGLLDELGDTGPDLLLEPMAGQGAALCAAVDDLGPYLDALEWHPRAGVCLDTCHVFAAGHDVASPEGMATMLDTLESTVGPQRLKLLHANDSKETCGSCRDRHENIGAGHIGAEPFAQLFTHPATRGVPVVVETPGRVEPHRRDVTTLQRLRSR